MSEPREPVETPPEGAEPPREGGDYAPSVAARLAIYQRAGGIVTPMITALIAFLIGGVVVLASGSNPLRTYKAIFNGTGLNWFWSMDPVAAGNLQQTLLHTTPLILTGLAVAFAFRCGMFNIGGQGQYIVGAIMAVWIGSSLGSLPGPLHIVLAIVLAAIAGALWAGIAGFLKATVGAHEVITTIMLNWIASGSAATCSASAAPSRARRRPPCRSRTTSSRARSCPSSGATRSCRACTSASSSPRAALVVFWLVLNRTTLGYEVRAVGFNPEAARYGGINVRRNYFLAMAIAGLFAGSPARWTSSAGSTGSRSTTSRSRRSASSGSRSRCSGATRPWGRSSRPCSSAPSSPALRRGTSTRASSGPIWRAT